VVIPLDAVACQAKATPNDLPGILGLDRIPVILLEEKNMKNLGVLWVVALVLPVPTIRRPGCLV